MLQSLLISCLLINVHIVIQGVRIEYPANQYIEERTRKDLPLIDPIFRYYLIPWEIQYHADALQDALPFFLQCKGSKQSINFTLPISATQHLILDTDLRSHTVTAKLRGNQLTADLVGRYTCSEIVNNKNQETSAYIFIRNGRTVFTKKTYPKVHKQTGVHFFNLPCQSTNWHARLSCPKPASDSQCQVPTCTRKEQQANELKCNTPTCAEEELCIPVYYTPTGLQPEKVFFDPQIGFALENPTLPSALSQFTCMSNYTPNQPSKVPFESVEPGYVQIHQPSFSVVKDETVKLTCEIQYGTKIDQRVPMLFWFEDVHNLNLVSNETGKPAFRPEIQVYSRNSSITLRGFKPKRVYRFYCVRISDHGLYSRSVDITCVNAPTLDVEITSSGSDTSEKASYGSASTYDISILTIPRSAVRLEVSRNGVSLANDKRFVLSEITSQEDQFFEYALTIHNVTFEDETDLKLTVKSSTLEKSKIIKPIITGNPVGQMAFAVGQGVSDLPWRDENFKDKVNVYPYGIAEKEPYRVACTVRHRVDIQQPLNIVIQYFSCPIETCLSTLIDRTCQRSSSQKSLKTTSKQINNFQTQLTSVESQQLGDPSLGYQYLCCYEQKGLISIAKAMAVLSSTRELFHVQRPDFSLVTGDVLTYRCEAHQSLYIDLRMIYNDGSLTYERAFTDQEWRLQGTNQVKRVDLETRSVTSPRARTAAIEVKTPPLQRMNSGQYLRCVALSNRLDVFPHANETYVIQVEDPAPLQFKAAHLPAVSKLDRKAGDNVRFDCEFSGRPKPKVTWLKGKVPFLSDDSTIQFGDSNQSISITRAQPVDSGYYTCDLNNGRDAPLRRSFDLRVKGLNPYSRIGRITAMIVIIAGLLLLLMLLLLLFLGVKYFRMKKEVSTSIFHEKEPTTPEDGSQPAMSQLTRIPLPDNFATTQQIRTLLNYVNGDQTPADRDDFKELGRGQFGVVYQVRLPEVGLVAAKLLPDSIRRAERRRDKRKKSHDLEEDEAMIAQEQEMRKTKAAEMLIDEIKVMHKAGNHVNIVALRKVAYPETKFKFLFIGGPIRDEDSFYLMELCANGSLESMLKRFDQSSVPAAASKPMSLYETLAQQNEQGMSLPQACDRCQLTDDDLKLIAYQVACGVDYLNRRQIAHCDIAARNVLVNSRFIMKICDFGLATWTTYRNYREQLARNESVQLEKKNNEIATHNLTPELAKAFLNASYSDDRLLLNKSSIKADVWSFGIFLWSLFLKCKVRPFHQLLEEVERSGENFFHGLAGVISEGRVLRYIDYRTEIPRNVYALIRLCLVEDSHRPEMTRVRALLCHSEMLSKQAFQYYRTEYNRYQEENATDEIIERFGDDQGVTELPTFDGESTLPNDRSLPTPDNSYTRPSSKNDAYYPTTDADYSRQMQDGYLTSTVTNASIPEVQITTQSVQKPSKPASPRGPSNRDDSYL